MISLIVPCNVEFGKAREVAARLTDEISGADPGVVFQLDISAPTSSILAVQIAEACRKTLSVAGRLAALGPVAAAALESALPTDPADSRHGVSA
jgi:hypothetical protein